MTWEPVIGLEFHVALATNSKAFSSSAVHFGAPPNSLVDPTVLGLPGSLPVFNAHALHLAIVLGLAVGSHIRPRSRFARKHYFYPDQPKGYQISQFDEPICEGGGIDIPGARRIELTRIHLEEDAGKNTHVGHVSHVDLDRAGVPLVEVVTEPVVTSAEEAANLMRALHRLVRWLGVSEADMEKGQMRCDANVSIRPAGTQALGTRTELKNINSFRFVQDAIEHEIARQIRLVDGGGKVVRETRLWDAQLGQSATMRTKEEADDYRYFPDPDLPPLVVPPGRIEELRAKQPELPAQKFDRYVAAGLSADDARTLIGERALAEYFDAACAGCKSPKLVANWVQTELLGALNAASLTIATSPIPPVGIAQLVQLIEAGTISGKIGKEVFEEAFKTSESPAAIVDRKGLQQISDPAALGVVIDEVLAANAKQVEAYRGGKETLFGFFVGAVMKGTKGKANPALTSELLKAKLTSGS